MSGRRSSSGIEHAALLAAVEHHGALSRRQLLQVGATPRMIDTWVSAGRWARPCRGVLTPTGSQDTWEKRHMVACLAAGDGAVLCGRSAAALWGFKDMPDDIVEISARKRGRMEGVKLRRFDLEPHEVTQRRGFPVTTVDRTLLDLSGILSPEAAEDCLEQALRNRLTAIPRLRDYVAEVSGPGVRGCRRLAHLVALRDVDSRALESRLETKLFRLIRRAGLAAPVAQLDVHDGRTFIARLDFAFPERMLAFEGDGYEFHSGRLRWKRDIRRRNKLLEMGWRVFIYTWDDVAPESNRVMAEMRRNYHSSHHRPPYEYRSVQRGG